MHCILMFFNVFTKVSHKFTQKVTPKLFFNKINCFSENKLKKMIRVHEFTHYFTPKLVKVCFLYKKCVFHVWE